jgi:hypothetical protein
MMSLKACRTNTKRAFFWLLMLGSLGVVALSPATALAQEVPGPDPNEAEATVPFAQLWQNTRGSDRYLQTGYAGSTEPVFKTIVDPAHPTSTVVKDKANWRVIRVAAGPTVQFKNSLSGKCISAKPYEGSRGFPAEMVTCDSVDQNQRFRLEYKTLGGVPAVFIYRYANGVKNCYLNLEYFYPDSPPVFMGPCGAEFLATWYYRNMNF